MNESYAEFLVKRKTPVRAYIICGVLSVFTLTSMFLALTANVLATIAVFVLGFTTYVSIRNARVEYEYLFVTGIFSVDKILGKAVRKKAFECSMEEIQMIMQTSDPELNGYRNGKEKVLDFSSGMSDSKTYTMFIQKETEHIRLIFEPNEQMIQCFRQMAPRKVRK